MGHNGDMSEAASPARNAFVGVVVSWVLALAIAVLIGALVDSSHRAPWLVLGFAAVIIATFAIQLWYASPVGFIFRVAASVGGALVVMGLISALFGLAAMIPA